MGDAYREGDQKRREIRLALQQLRPSLVRRSAGRSK
jgi:hypothetical protein